MIDGWSPSFIGNDLSHILVMLRVGIRMREILQMGFGKEEHSSMNKVVLTSLFCLHLYLVMNGQL